MRFNTSTTKKTAKVWFDSHPKKVIKDRLKADGYRWSKGGKFWYRQRGITGSYTAEQCRKEIERFLAKHCFEDKQLCPGDSPVRSPTPDLKDVEIFEIAKKTQGGRTVTQVYRLIVDTLDAPLVRDAIESPTKYLAARKPQNTKTFNSSLAVYLCTTRGSRRSLAHMICERATGRYSGYGISFMNGNFADLRRSNLIVSVKVGSKEKSRFRLSEQIVSDAPIPNVPRGAPNNKVQLTNEGIIQKEPKKEPYTVNRSPEPSDTTNTADAFVASIISAFEKNRGPDLAPRVKELEVRIAELEDERDTLSELSKAEYQRGYEDGCRDGSVKFMEDARRKLEETLGRKAATASNNGGHG